MMNMFCLFLDDYLGGVMQISNTFYSKLGLPKNFSTEELNNAFVNKATSNCSKNSLLELCIIYKVFSNPKYKEIYDKDLEANDYYDYFYLTDDNCEFKKVYTFIKK